MGSGFLEAPVGRDSQDDTGEAKLFANLSIACFAAPCLRDALSAGYVGRVHSASVTIAGNDAIGTLVQGVTVELAPLGRTGRFL